MVETDFESCFQCKWLGNDPLKDPPCCRCNNHSLYEPKNKEEKVDDTVSRFKEFEGYKKDNINPDHYKSETSLECIEAMEIIFGRDAVIDFCVCNAWKYIWRWKNKNGQEDLRKADWYLTRAHDMTCGDDKRADMIRGMIHYVNNHRGVKCDG